MFNSNLDNSKQQVTQREITSSFTNQRTKKNKNIITFSTFPCVTLKLNKIILCLNVKKNHSSCLELKVLLLLLLLLVLYLFLSLCFAITFTIFVFFSSAKCSFVHFVKFKKEHSITSELSLFIYLFIFLYCVVL